MDLKNQQNNFNNPLVIILILSLVGLGSYVLFSKNSNSGVENKISETAPVEYVPDTNNQPSDISEPKMTKTQNTNINFELSQNPEYLFSKEFNPNEVKVYGVGIGDSESQIDHSTIKQETEYWGWVHTTNNIGYRIANGKIVEIALSNAAVGRMGLSRQDEIFIRFGKPDQTKETGDAPYRVDTYYYISKGLIVYWYETAGLGVNIIGSQ